MADIPTYYLILIVVTASFILWSFNEILKKGAGFLVLSSIFLFEYAVFFQNVFKIIDVVPEILMKISLYGLVLAPIIAFMYCWMYRRESEDWSI
jgi:hypothetical protein